jgi:ketosteroid isomerase-like protein
LLGGVLDREPVASISLKLSITHAIDSFMFRVYSWPRLRGIALVMCAAGCSPPARPSTNDTTAASAEVREQFDSLVAAIRRLDVESMLAGYANDTALTRALDGRLLRGRSVVEEDFRRGFGAVRRIDTLVIGDRALQVLSPTAVVLTVPLREIFTDTTGARTTLRGTWTSVWHRGPAGWQIVHDAAVHVPDQKR